VNGPSGNGVADLYTPEIASIPTTVPATEPYDDLKVQAILNEIAGKDHTGTKTEPVPVIFGMNFQAVSVAQKDPNGGYLDANATPSPLLQGALDHTAQSVGKLLDALRKQNLFANTTIILTAKHGQSPIDPSLHQIVDKHIIPNIVNSVQAGLLAQATEDDVALIWLKDQSKTNAVVAALNANKAQAHIDTILSGASLLQYFNDPTTDSRTPDIVVLPTHGVIYASLTATKIAEHGGFSDDDTHVSLFVSNPHLDKGSISTPVQTTQIAPTILHLLGLDPNKLQAVGMEHTQLLPGLD
jgi:arylsulfatase A-like enzyme